MLSELLSSFDALDHKDRILVGRFLNHVSDNYPELYDDFIRQINIPKYQATRLRNMSRSYFELPFNIQARIDDYPSALRLALLSPKTSPEVLNAIINGEITTEEELSQNRPKPTSDVSSQITAYRNKKLADKISNMDSAFREKFLSDLYFKYGKRAYNTFSVATKDKDSTAYPNREADFIVEVIGYGDVKRFYDGWLY